MKTRSESIACLGIAESASLSHIKVPVGSTLESVQVGRETVYLLIACTDSPQEEYIDAGIFFEGRSLEGRLVGSFIYPLDRDGRRPRSVDEEQACIAYVVEFMTEDGRPKRTALR